MDWWPMAVYWGQAGEELITTVSCHLPFLSLPLHVDKGNRKQGRDDPAPKPLVDHPFSVDYSNTVSYCLSKRKVVEAKVGEG